MHRLAPRPLTGNWITVEGAKEHNLQHVTARFPLGVMTVVTGVSGSGKTTLVADILYRALARDLYGSREDPGEHGQSSASTISIRRSDRSVADWADAALEPGNLYRRVYGDPGFVCDAAGVARARIQGGAILFNVAGGRCEACQGDGQRRIEMNFLPDVYVQCEVCNGRRYNQETLAVKFNGYSIADVLDLAIEDALPVLETFRWSAASWRRW